MKKDIVIKFLSKKLIDTTWDVVYNTGYYLEYWFEICKGVGRTSVFPDEKDCIEFDAIGHPNAFEKDGKVCILYAVTKDGKMISAYNNYNEMKYEDLEKTLEGKTFFELFDYLEDVILPDMKVKKYESLKTLEIYKELLSIIKNEIDNSKSEKDKYELTKLFKYVFDLYKQDSGMNLELTL